MKFFFKKIIVFLVSMIGLNCLACSSRGNERTEAKVPTQIAQPEPDPGNRQSSKLDSNLLYSAEGMTLVWIKKHEPVVPGIIVESESSLVESGNVTSIGIREKRHVNSLYYYEVIPDQTPDKMPWQQWDAVQVEDKPPVDKEKAVKASLILVAAVAGKILLKLSKLFLAAISPLLLVPTLLYTSFLAGIFIGRLFQARNTAISTVVNPAVPGTTTTTTTTTMNPSTGTGMADLWTGTNLSGAGAAIDGPIGTCVDFPPVFDKMLQSLDTKNSCVIICDTAGCVGACIMFTNAGVVNDLGSFNNMASSLQFC